MCTEKMKYSSWKEIDSTILSIGIMQWSLRLNRLVAESSYRSAKLGILPNRLVKAKRPCLPKRQDYCPADYAIAFFSDLTDNSPS